MIIQTWSQVLVQSFQDLWLGVIAFVPNIIVAVIILLVGWVIGALLGRVVAQVINSLSVDKALRSTGLDEVMDKAGLELNSGRFLGGLVKWFVIVAFLVAALDVLHLTQVNDFLAQVVLLYLPRVIVAVLILLVAALIAEAMHGVVVGGAKAAEVKSAAFLGRATKWAIWTFAVLVALYQLGVAGAFVQTLFTGFVVAVSLAFGLAFGLGGKEVAGRYLEKVSKEIKED